MPNKYFSEKNIETQLKLRELLTDLPKYCAGFFQSLENSTRPSTRLVYAYDLRIFFEYLANEPTSPIFGKINTKEISIEQLSSLKLADFRGYLSFLDIYFRQNGDISIERSNSESGRKRKLCSLRRFFKYLYNEELIKENIVSKIETPRIPEKPIIRLDDNEIINIIQVVSSGEGLTDRQKVFHARDKYRDIAIIVLFLTTGIRKSELIGLNIGDINFSDNSFVITRKGGKSTILYFGDLTKKTLEDYLETRKNTITYSSDMPLFITSSEKRISPDAVENLVKKYAKISAPLKKISPHKLRSTYGTKLYKDTGDIYLVAEVLGHADVNTTKRHYAAMSEESRKYAAKAYKIDVELDKDQ